MEINLKIFPFETELKKTLQFVIWKEHLLQRLNAHGMIIQEVTLVFCFQFVRTKLSHRGCKQSNKNYFAENPCVRF